MFTGVITLSRRHAFPKTGKMRSLALGNSHLLVELFTVEWGHFVNLCHGDSASDRQMDASSKLSNIVDQSDPHHDCYKCMEFLLCLRPALFALFR